MTEASLTAPVRVRVLVDSKGRVVKDSTQIVASGGSTNDRLARDAAEQWKFYPAVHDGCSVWFWYEFRIGS